MRSVTRVLSNAYSVFLSLLSRIFLIFQLFLFLRLLLKFLGANPEALVVSIIYKYSTVLISPFELIFRNLHLGGRLIEMSTVSAMIGYAIAMFIILRILRLFQKEY